MIDKHKATNILIMMWKYGSPSSNASHFNDLQMWPARPFQVVVVESCISIGGKVKIYCNRCIPLALVSPAHTLPTVATGDLMHCLFSLAKPCEGPFRQSNLYLNN